MPDSTHRSPGAVFSPESRVGPEVNDDTEGQPKIRQREPGEDKGSDVVLKDIWMSGAEQIAHGEGLRTIAWTWKKNMRMMP